MKQLCLILIAVLGLAACAEDTVSKNNLNDWYGPKATNVADDKYKTIFNCRVQSPDASIHFYYRLEVENDSLVQESESKLVYSKASLIIAEAQISEQSSTYKDLEIQYGTLAIEDSMMSVDEDGQKGLEFPGQLYRLIKDDQELISVAYLLNSYFNTTKTKLPGLENGQLLSCQGDL